MESSLSSRVLAGQAQLRKKDYATARTNFSIARTIDRSNPDAQVGLIQIALMVGNYHKARQMIGLLGRTAPRVFSGNFDVARWHESQEAYDEFLRRFRDEIRDTTKAGEMIRVLLGYVAWTEGDRQRALGQIKQAAAEVPQELAWVNIIQALESPGEGKTEQSESKQDKKTSSEWPAL
ncbi:MAG: tetratricopeptide repeat protein [Phycisphaerae bacterium]|nr:tetratricopeptide repeat protein [Phycisphaerae bacterium]